MRVAVEDMDGVEEAVVSLNDGRVSIRLAPDNAVTIAALRRVIRERGFSPREATVTASVRIERRGNRVVAVVPGTDMTYDIVASGELRAGVEEAIGRTVAIEGVVADDLDEVTPSELRVTAIAPPS